MEKLPPFRKLRLLRYALAVLFSMMSLTGCTSEVGAGQEIQATGAQDSSESAESRQVPSDQAPAANQPVSTPPAAIEIAWSKIPGEIRDIGIGGVDEQAIWVVGGESVPGGFEVSYWTGSGWDIIEGSAAVAIDVGPSGYPWIVTRENRIFEWTGTDWAERPGEARDIGIGADGSVWIIGTDPVPGGYSIRRWTETSWEGVPGGAVAIDVYARGDLDEQRQGEPWMVNADHQISRWDGSEWERQPGEAQDIGVGANGAVWIIGTTPTTGGYNIATWNGEDWAAAPGGGVRISVNPDGFPFAVTDDQQLLQGT